MIVLQAHNISKSFGERLIFRNVSLAVNDKERIGIVGVNGSGKTTLLKCLTGALSADEGEVMVSGLKSTGYLEQLPETKPGTTAWESVMGGFSALIEQRLLLRKLEQDMAQGGADLQRIMDRYARVTEEYERANGYACENFARRILSGLAFSVEEFDKPLDNFSGGQKTRLNLGRLLALTPDILLLDEPTNHLDIDSVEWLEEFLKSYPGTVLVVSHDRMFLDRVATRTIEMAGGKLKSFNGNYSNYLKIKAQDDEAARRAYDKQQEYIQRTEDYIRRFKAGIKSKQARGRQLQLERLERLDETWQDQVITDWKILMKQESGQDVLTIADLSKSFGDLKILHNVSLRIQKGEKIALVGPNGCGKTTLLKMIIGEAEPDQGQIKPGSRVDIGYFSQEHEDLNPEHTLLEEILYSFDLT
ncbi:MAG: ABC-F family ATP-binding cassette domain-containing protein, partial [Syntrophomonas sp.]